MSGLFRAVDGVSRYLGLAVAHFYFVCALITAYEVTLRYLFNAPTLWAFEVVMVVCASAWVLSGAYVTMRRNHIAITVLYQYARGRLKWCLDLFILTVTLLAMATLCYSVWGPMTDALGGVERSGSSFNSPEPMILKTLLFTGAFLYALQTLVNLLRHLAGRDGEARPLLESE